MLSTLGEVMPLKVEYVPGKCNHSSARFGSCSIKPDLIACNGIIHVIDSVLLPFDGDGVLDDDQKKMVGRDSDFIPLNGPGTIADDVIGRNMAAILLSTTRSRIWTLRAWSP